MPTASVLRACLAENRAIRFPAIAHPKKRHGGPWTGSRASRRRDIRRRNQKPVIPRLTLAAKVGSLDSHVLPAIMPALRGSPCG